MECPCCNTVGAYVEHDNTARCNTCESRVCIKCFFGCRYMCPLVQAANPPSTPIERQITLDKWEECETVMKQNTELKELLVLAIPGHEYWVVRKDGNLVRVHKRV